MSQEHNFNAPPVAQLARVIMGEQYSQQNGGTYDFWLTLPDSVHHRYTLALSEALKQAKKLNIPIEELIED